MEGADENGLIDALRDMSVQPSSKAEMRERVAKLREGVLSSDPVTQLEATTKFRRILSIERSPPVAEVVESGVVPRLVSFLAPAQSPQLRFEAAWAVTNIASSSTAHTQTVVDCGAVALFITMISSDSVDLVEQAIWGLGNIAGDSWKLRNFVLKSGAMKPLLGALGPDKKLSLLRNGVWTLSNFCRGKPQPSLDEVKPSIPFLCKIINVVDEEVLTDALWALSYITDGQNERIQLLLDTAPDVPGRLVELLTHKSDNVKTPCLRTVGNCVSGDDHQTQAFVARGVLPRLFALLSNKKKGIRKEAAWAVSNITAGSAEQIGSVLAIPALVPRLLTILKEDDFDIKKEAAWAISNLTSGGTPAHIARAFELGAVPALSGLLSCSDARILEVALTGLENILAAMQRADGSPNPAATALEDAGDLEALEQLQHHANESIYSKSLSLLERYFQVEPAGGEEAQGAPVGVGTDQGFMF